MRKILFVLLLGLMLTGITACGGKKDEAGEADTADTMGAAYLAVFDASEAKDADTAAQELIDAGILETELVKMEVTPGYLDGFTDEISGFTSGVKFSPMIGSIPFVGYVFETEDPEALLEVLQAGADPAWNICTQADETVSGTRGQLVFFLMCSNEE